MTFNIEKNSRLNSKKFLYGVATASFQIEGGKDSRLDCIWDTFCATEGKIADSSNGEVACEHYHLWQEDVALIDSLGVDAYRLSLSWPRLVTIDNRLNYEGVNFYIKLLDELNRRGIKPFVTFYHWDLPQHIEDNGGWLNRDTAYLFGDYVELVSLAFGDRVSSYATLNEPFCSSYLGYEVGVHAPGLVGKDNGRKAAHHLLLAHGLAMDVLKTNCPDIPSGIVLNFTPCYPKTNSDEDLAATSYADDYINQWYMKPVMEGKYPEIIDTMPVSQQPEIRDGDMAIISSPIDFLGVNFYTRLHYQAHDSEPYHELEHQPPLTDIGWEIYPKALTELLISLNEKYDLPPIYITENGAAIADTLINGKVEDDARIDYIESHLQAVDAAVNAGVDVRGYFVWSLMDNFEWAEGYTKRFGIVYVDYKTQIRTIKKSGLAYRDFLSSRI